LQVDNARRDGRAARQQTCVSLRSPALDASNRGIAGVTGFTDSADIGPTGTRYRRNLHRGVCVRSPWRADPGAAGAAACGRTG